MESQPAPAQQPPPVYVALLFHLKTVLQALGERRWHGKVTPRWEMRTAGPVAFLAFNIVRGDPDHAVRVACSWFISLGFYCGWASDGTRTLMLTGYHGDRIALEAQPVEAPASQPIAAGPVQPPPPPPPPPSAPVMRAAQVPGLISGPSLAFDRFVSERWVKGPASAARIRQIRAAVPGHVSVKSVEHTQRASSEPGADRRSIAAVEMTYCVPPGVTVPAPSASSASPVVGGEAAA